SRRTCSAHLWISARQAGFRWLPSPCQPAALQTYTTPTWSRLPSTPGTGPSRSPGHRFPSTAIYRLRSGRPATICAMSASMHTATTSCSGLRMPPRARWRGSRNSNSCARSGWPSRSTSCVGTSHHHTASTRQPTQFASRPCSGSEGMNDASHAGNHRASALRVFAIEAEAVGNLANLIDDDFSRAVEQILQSRGRTIVCGMGKSGIIGRKIAATMASTGTPSFFMHPGEAYHGDLGMVTSDDTFIAISFSGETDEVLKLLPFLKDNGNFIVAITGNPESTLATAADCHLNVRVDEEACPLRLAPTSSTTATLAMGDAMAVTLMEARGFRPENFARFHPGGSLGRRLLSRVEH